MGSNTLKQFKPKPCKHCKIVFTPQAPCNLFCSDCQKLKPEWERQRCLRKRFRTGVGKGGGQRTGKDSPFWTKGLGWYPKEGKRLKALHPFCERCQKDLRNVRPVEWCTHHRDHNRLNNVTENLEILCKQCHQQEHEAGKHFRKNAELK